MAVYVAEPIDISDLKTLIENNWDTKSGNEIPRPAVFVSDRQRMDPSITWQATPQPGYINISHEPIIERQDGYAYAYVRVEMLVNLDIRTKRENPTVGGSGRQYLHDVKQELRRIIYSNKHSLANWQIMEYVSFEENWSQSNDVGGSARMQVRLRNDGILVPTALVDEDLFNRADGGIGAEWTQDSGTWNIVSNRAALQSATADAIARFTPAGVTFKNNHLVRVDLVTADSMDAGLIFRWVDASNYWIAKLIETGGVKFLRLIEVVAGTPTQKGEIREPGWTDGDTVELGVNLVNGCIAVLYNAFAMIQVTDETHLTGVSYGLYSNADQTTRFDNFHIFESGGSGR